MADHYHYHIYFKPEPEGGYTVTVPALPGCISFGKTLPEAEAMVKDAIQAYLASMQKHGELPALGDEGLLGMVDIPASA